MTISWHILTISWHFVTISLPNWPFLVWLNHYWTASSRLEHTNLNLGLDGWDGTGLDPWTTRLLEHRLDGANKWRKQIQELGADTASRTQPLQYLEPGEHLWKPSFLENLLIQISFPGVWRCNQDRQIPGIIPLACFTTWRGKGVWGSWNMAILGSQD